MLEEDGWSDFKFDIYELEKHLKAMEGFTIQYVALKGVTSAVNSYPDPKKLLKEI